jgi:hypothetical protein
MKLKTGLFSLAAAGLASVGAFGAVATLGAGAASATPPIVIHTTSVQTSDVHVGPAVQILRSSQYQPSPTAVSGFVNVANTVEVCFNVPHIVPAGRLTIIEACSWRATSTAPGHPTLSGTAFVNGIGQVGHIGGGTGIDTGAHGTFSAINLAPKVSAETLIFTL